jgi:hypothetical protein
VSSNSEARLCGPDCPTPELPHRDPEPDWIGNYPVEHGESDYPVPGTGGWNGLYTESRDMYCLCGHPDYMWCPMWPSGGIGGLTIAQDDNGVIGVAEDPTFVAGGEGNTHA